MLKFLLGLPFNDITCAAIGGAIVALASSLHLLFTGRLVGMSGMYNTIIKMDIKDSLAQKYFFYFGMICCVVGLQAFVGEFLKIGKWKLKLFDTQKEVMAGISICWLAIGGLLVGLGSKLGNGCTIGHGVSGVARLSSKSFIATAIFLIVGVLSGTFFSNGNSFFRDIKIDPLANFPWISHSCISLALLSLAFVLGIFIVAWTIHGKKKEAASTGNAPGIAGEIISIAVSFVLGIVFATGLIIAGLLCRSKVSKFVNFLNPKGWNPFLLFFLLSAFAFNAIAFKFIQARPQPVLQAKFSLPPLGSCNWRTVVGAIVFGLGYGIAGYCTGPAVLSMFLVFPIIAYVATMSAGQVISDAFFPQPKSVPVPVPVPVPAPVPVNDPSKEKKE